MPNGLNISKQSDTWRRLEAPLLQADPVLKSFTNREGMNLIRNYRNWPERAITWSSRGLRRGIRIVLDDPKKETYSVQAWASAGVGMTWKSRELFLKKGVGWPEITVGLGDLLTQAFNTADQWSEQELNASRRVDVGAILRRHQP